MSRHIIDKAPRSNTGARLRAFLAIARADGQHPATEKLIRRPSDRTVGGRRLREFLRIARGHQV